MPEEQPTKPKPARPRNAVQRSTAPEQFMPISVDANQVAKQLRNKLVEMLDTASLLRADRRRATAIDRVDFESAFDDIVSPALRQKRLVFIGDICGIFGAGFIGYSINIYTGTGSA